MYRLRLNIKAAVGRGRRVKAAKSEMVLRGEKYFPAFLAKKVNNDLWKNTGFASLDNILFENITEPILRVIDLNTKLVNDCQIAPKCIS